MIQWKAHPYLPHEQGFRDGHVVARVGKNTTGTYSGWQVHPCHDARPRYLGHFESLVTAKLEAEWAVGRVA